MTNKLDFKYSITPVAFSYKYSTRVDVTVIDKSMYKDIEPVLLSFYTRLLLGWHQWNRACFSNTKEGSSEKVYGTHYIF